jgi:lipopolysaccharide/colanic/teichoic acid biosynthesis glycosyltransferase
MSWVPLGGPILNIARKFAVTGASGHVGRLLIRRLLAEGAEVTAVGRDPDRLRALFPRCNAVSYGNLAHDLAGHDLVIHLAVANTGSSLPDEEIRAVNVDLSLATAKAAAAAGVPCFMDVSSVHALDAGNINIYAQSRREATRRLAEVPGIDVRTVHLGAVHDGSQRSGSFSGKLSVLNGLPGWIASGLFWLLSAAKPTTDIALLARHVTAADLPPAEVILTDDKGQNLVYLACRKAVDIGFAVGVTVFLGWFLVLVWIAVRLETAGPGFFRQERVGRLGRRFTCWKFRSMRVGTPHVATHEVSHDAVTKVGRFLRWTKIDELPQIWNLLRGEMTIVGPRPCLPSQTELMAERNARGVDDATPGITGLAQVNGVDMSAPRTLAEIDGRYVALRCLLLDWKIIWRTAFGRSS